jgi:prolyl 4-hydroxylase
MDREMLLIEADRLLATGQAARAVSMVTDAAERGDVDALFRLASWSLTGGPLPRDLSRARTLLRRAVEIGHVDAALLEIALTANGAGAPPSWPTALALLTVAARHDPVAVQQLALLDAMNLTADGHPAADPTSVTIATQPDIRHFPALLTMNECAHLANAASDLLAPAVVVDPRTGRNVPHPIRSSDGAVIGPMRESLVVRAINQRLAAVTATDVAQGEALTILRYRPGQQFRPHFDAIGQSRNQRTKTVLIYLNEGFVGGETQFPKIGVTIRPKAGDAIAFTNTRDDDAADPLSLHAGLPVMQGVKWLATRWIRKRPFDAWDGPEAPIGSAVRP